MKLCEKSWTILRLNLHSEHLHPHAGMTGLLLRIQVQKNPFFHIFRLKLCFSHADLHAPLLVCSEYLCMQIYICIAHLVFLFLSITSITSFALMLAARLSIYA